MSIAKDRVKQPREKVSLGLALSGTETLRLAKGEVFIEMVDGSSGEVLHKEHRTNVITVDAGILAAILFRDPDSRTNGANMLAVGTGALGAILSPNAPDPDQRKLNAEIERKPWSSTTFRDADGTAVAIPTNIVDFTVTYDEAEAVGPLNEMGILSTISDNVATTNPNPDTFPNRDVTRDLTLYDILVNYLTFSVISKPNTARLTITWRITF
jgi:hypothetical protein